MRETVSVVMVVGFFAIAALAVRLSLWILGGGIDKGSRSGREDAATPSSASLSQSKP